MSDIALINGDVAASNSGDILIIDDDADVIQMAVNNIMTIQGANEFHTEIGNTVYSNRFKMSQRGLEDIANRCKNAILNDSRVRNVLEIIAKNASTVDNYGLCEVSFVLLTIHGKQLNSNVTIML